MTFNYTAHFIDDQFQWIIPAIVVIAVAAWITGFVVHLRTFNKKRTVFDQPRRYPKSYYIALSIFIGVIGLLTLNTSFIEKAAIDEFWPILQGHIDEVKVNGHLLTDSTHLINDMRQLHTTLGHHSHPVEQFDITLKSEKGTAVLILARDSQDPHEYWVYYPAFHSTNVADLGRVFTSSLDALPR